MRRQPTYTEATVVVACSNCGWDHPTTIKAVAKTETFCCRSCRGQWRRLIGKKQPATDKRQLLLPYIQEQEAPCPT